MLGVTLMDFCSKVTKVKGLQMIREALRKTDVPEEVGSVCLLKVQFLVGIGKSTNYKFFRLSLGAPPIT